MFKKFSAILLTLLAIFILQGEVKALETATLFFSNSCPHCKLLEEQITEKGYRSKLTLLEKEVTGSKENLNEFEAAIKTCGFPLDQAGVPMVFSANRCYMGQLDALNELMRLVGDTGPSLLAESTEAKGPAPSLAITSENLPVVTPVIAQVVASVITQEEAKRNTLAFIGIMTLGLTGLVAIGYWKQGAKKKKVLAVTTFLMFFNAIAISNSIPVNAFCPVCTIAVGAGLGVSKYLGIDDVISGIWIGGLTVSMTMWLINWLTSKKIKFFGRKPLVILLMFAMVIVPLQWGNMINSVGNTLWGFDKILLGMTFGTVGFIFGFILNKILVKKNKNEVFFPFQKVVLPILSMILLSLFFFFIVY